MAPDHSAADGSSLRNKFRRSPRAVPEMQDVYDRLIFIAHVKDQKRRQWHFADSAPLIIVRKASWHCGQLNARSTSFSPKRIAASGLSAATNSIISLRSAIALSAIRTLKSIAESSPLLLRWGGLGPLGRLEGRVRALPPRQHHPAPYSSRTIRQREGPCRVRSNERWRI